MNLFTIASLITGFTTLILGLFCLYKKPKNNLIRIWFFYTLSISLWGFGATWISITTNEANSFFAWKIVIALGVIWIAPLFYNFIFLLCELKEKVDNLILKISYILASIFALLVFLSPLGSFTFLKGVRFVFNSFYYWIPGSIFYLFFAWWVFMVSYSFFKLIRTYFKIEGLKKNKIKYFIFAMAIGYIFGSLAYLPGFGIDLYPAYGTFGIPVYVFIISYAILKHQLLDLKIVIRRAFLYSIIISFISFSLSIVGFVNVWVIENYDFPFWLLPLIAALVSFLIGNFFWLKSKETENLKLEFINVITHKFFTPLTKAKWALEGLNFLELSEKNKELILAAKEAGKELTELIKLFFEVMAKGDTKYTDAKVVIDLKELIGKLILKFKIKIKEKGLNFSLDLPDSLPNVFADADKIKSVISILLDNAINYTPEKGQINISLHHYDNFLKFSIKDSGIGIEKQEQKFIFSKFFRTNDAILAHTEGIGIGLILAQAILERHGGELGFESDGKDKGSLFWFTLPIVG
jgi:signal transduction histidine kinase